MNSTVDNESYYEVINRIGGTIFLSEHSPVGGINCIVYYSIHSILQYIQ